MAYVAVAFKWKTVISMEVETMKAVLVIWPDARGRGLIAQKSATPITESMKGGRPLVQISHKSAYGSDSIRIGRTEQYAN